MALGEPAPTLISYCCSQSVWLSQVVYFYAMKYLLMSLMALFPKAARIVDVDTRAAMHSIRKCRDSIDLIILIESTPCLIKLLPNRNALN